MTGAIASRFKCVLRNVATFSKVAVFDSWLGLVYNNIVNGVGAYTITLSADDPRISLFELDGIFEIYRSTPGSAVPWYQEGIYLNRTPVEWIDDSGKKLYSHSGVGLNDLLARTEINYPAATIKSYKLAPSETCMKEYVEENCGPSATMAIGNERESDGVLPNFEVELDSGYGIEWEGDKAFENLLETLQEIAKFSNIDFNVEWTESSGKFIFKTFPDQLGLDRTTVGLIPSTGINSHGNSPVIFSMELGNVKNIKKTYDRGSEVNVVSVLGEGDGATREVQLRSLPSKLDSPWNRREVSRPKSGFESEMQIFGDGVLADLSAKEVIEFAPLRQPSTLYGKHFFFGDKITVKFNDIDYHKRVSEVSNSVIDMEENPSFVFADLK